MKVAVLHGPKDLRIDEHPLDTSYLEPDELWVKTEISALKIGTDRGNYEGAERVPTAADYPRRVGDSNLGIVRGVGSEVDLFRVGDRVLARQNHLSEYKIKQSAYLVRVPDCVHSEDAVFTHLYSLSAYCYFKAHFRPAENVAIVGLGVLGLGAVALGPLFGARVAAIGNSSVRIEMARKMGAHAAFLHDDPDLGAKLDEFTGGSGVDLVILAANPWPAFRTSLQIVKSGGRVSIVSNLGRGEKPLDFNPLPMELFAMKGISLIAVEPLGYLRSETPDRAVTMDERFTWHWVCRYILSLMADGRLKPKRLVTHRFDYINMAEAYEMALRREKEMLGVIFRWHENRYDAS